MRYARVALALLSTQLACALATAPEEEFNFSFEAKEIPTWADSAAYAVVIPPSRIDLIGFYSECSYSMQGELARVEDQHVVVDARIHLCENALCIRDKHTRYRASLTDVPPGKHRIVLEQVIRNCFSGALLDSTAMLDTLVTLP